MESLKRERKQGVEFPDQSKSRKDTNGKNKAWYQPEYFENEKVGFKNNSTKNTKDFFLTSMGHFQKPNNEKLKAKNNVQNQIYRSNNNKI